MNQWVRNTVFALLSGTFLMGCAHTVHLSHVSDFSPTYDPYENGQMVEAAEEQFVILGFVTQTDYVNKAYQKIQKECKNGEIQGINTEYSTALGFFSWTNRVRMKGLCIKAS